MPYQSIFSRDLFRGQTIVVTGGGSGIGRCTAHELAALGATVLITGRKREKLDATVAELHEDGASAASYAFDIRDEDAVTATVAQIVAEHGPIHGLVNNAGGQYPMPLASIGKKGWDAVIANNLSGGFLMSREVYRQSMQMQGGAIVNMIADMWGGMPLMGHSGAARAGMMNLTETAAVEWAPSGVRVNAVAPGFIASSGMAHYDEKFRTETIPQMAGLAALKRMGEEDEVAAAIVFLLSPAAAFITGACLKIDGGTSLSQKMLPVPAHGASTPFHGFHRGRHRRPA
ncbi:SDR family oxidoreductase [Nevskia sp.]|uniref:SDR family oxidoreductase n=1 Tax=Nevskia sp. TaxID=1929292 RepID=UPI0025D9E5D5|nr:SDR family oxidoreductase [Nevskia sp.]